MNNRQTIKLILFKLFARNITMDDAINKLLQIDNGSKASIELSMLKDTRKRHGYTLRQVKSLTGISDAYLSQLENGKIKKPSFVTMDLLNKLYNPQSIIKS